MLWGEADPEQFLPQLQRLLEVSVACLVVPSKNPVEQLQRGAGHAAVVDSCRRGCSSGDREHRSDARPSDEEPRIVSSLSFDGHCP